MYEACLLQRRMGSLYNPQLIRDWLTVPTANEHDRQPSVSLAAVLTASSPFFFVHFANFAFLTGLIIYQAFVFIRNLEQETGTKDSRNIFVVLILGIGLYAILFSLTFRAKDMESTISSHAAQELEPIPQKNGKSENHVANEDAQTNNHRIAQDQPTIEPLQEALQAAAQAHQRCAEADAEVAKWFSKEMNPPKSH